jgi:hypothetical protein
MKDMEIGEIGDTLETKKTIKVKEIEIKQNEKPN